jgi:hypothetical protein
MACWLLALAGHCTAADSTTVVFPRSEADEDQRSHYPTKLLEMALKRAPGNYRLKLSDIRMQQARGMLMLQRNEGIDIVCYMTSAEREADMLAIKIPIDRGLIGWRLMLVSKTRPLKDGFQGLDRIKRLNAVQGGDWPDTAILRANGFQVHTTTSYGALFLMLGTHRVDYFPRGIAEIWQEADRYHDKLEVEPGVVLRYPSALYYFVRKGNEKLAEAVTAGLDKMIADGSFHKLFMGYYGAGLKRANVRHRRIYDIANPLLPDGIPAARQSLMYRE